MFCPFRTKISLVTPGESLRAASRCTAWQVPDSTTETIQCDSPEIRRRASGSRGTFARGRGPAPARDPGRKVAFLAKRNQISRKAAKAKKKTRKNHRHYFQFIEVGCFTPSVSFFSSFAASRLCVRSPDYSSPRNHRLPLQRFPQALGGGSRAAPCGCDLPRPKNAQRSQRGMQWYQRTSDTSTSWARTVVIRELLMVDTHCCTCPQ
jgi:hypothetical protein